MKKLLWLAVCLPLLVSAQVQDSSWSVIVTEPLFQSCFDIARGPDQDIWAVGQWFDEPNQIMDWYVIRFDPRHQLASRWRIEDAAGGTCRGVLPLDANLTVLYGSDRSYLTVQIRAWTDTGQQVWERDFGGAVVELNQGIRTRDQALLFCGDWSELNSGQAKFWLIKTNFAGDTIWTRKYGTSNLNYAVDVIETSDGGYLLVGYHGVPQNTGDVRYECEIIRTDSGGDSLWGRLYNNGDAHDFANSVIEMGAEFWIVGTLDNHDNPHPAGWMLRVDHEGNQIESRALHPDGLDSSMSRFDRILRVNGDEVVLVGRAGIMNTDQQYGWIVGLDSLADVTWTRFYGTGHGCFTSAVLADSGGLILGGQDWSEGESDLMLMGTTRVETPNSARDSRRPLEFSLSQNFPNPFNPTTQISFVLPRSGMTTLKVYDLLGKEVSTLIDHVMPSGDHTASFDGNRLASGIYFYRLDSESFTATRKMVLLK